MALKGVVGWLAGVLALFLGIFYQQSPLLQITLRSFREGHQLTNNSNCTEIPGTPDAPLEACEKLVVHQETGLVYLACSTIAERLSFAAYFTNFGPVSSTNDYLALYDPRTSTAKRLNLLDFPDDRGIHAHGLDVVPSRSDPSMLWVYVVNHRPQRDQSKYATHGADEAIEVFKTRVGEGNLVHVGTFDDASVIITPNDIAGSDDGDSFYFTNDHPSRVGKWDRFAALWFGTPSTSIGYCHISSGCKLVAEGIPGANGIVKTDPDTVWVAGATDGRLRSFTKQADQTLVLADVVNIGRLIDNLSTDGKGNIYAAIAAANPPQAGAYMANPIGKRCQTAAYNISLNTGRSAYFGEKYSIEKMFEDDGSLINCATTVAYDAEGGVRYHAGIFEKAVVVCPA